MSQHVSLSSFVTSMDRGEFFYLGSFPATPMKLIISALTGMRFFYIKNADLKTLVAVHIVPRLPGAYFFPLLGLDSQKRALGPSHCWALFAGAMVVSCPFGEVEAVALKHQDRGRFAVNELGRE